MSRVVVGSAFVFCTFALFGCGTTSLVGRVVDPHLIDVEEDNQRGGTILGASTSPATETVPGTDGGWVARASSGAITFGYDERPRLTVVSADGVLVVTGPPGGAASPLVQDARALRATYTYRWPLQGRFRWESATYSTVLTTPWTNVLEVRERKALDRGGGRAAIILGSIVLLIGGAALASGVLDPNGRYVAGTTRIIAGSVLLAGGGLMIGFGGFNAFAAERERVVYRR